MTKVGQVRKKKKQQRKMGLIFFYNQLQKHFRKEKSKMMSLYPKRYKFIRHYICATKSIRPEV